MSAEDGNRADENSGLERQIVTRRQQRAIALWATKTAMMCDLTQATPILRADQLRRMLTHRAIPHSARIYAGAWLSLNPLVTHHTVEWTAHRISKTRATCTRSKKAPFQGLLSSGGRI